MEFLRTELDSLRKASLYRQLRWFEGPQSPRTTVNGRNCILLSSNNYLGLTDHPQVKDAACQALARWGTGSGGSRLISGNFLLYRELEEKIAQFKNTEEVIVFSSGYLTNIGTISSLAGAEDAVISDELNHASIIDGCRLSRARVVIFGHKDMQQLEKAFSETQDCRRRLVITDGVFSMDGDLAPLPEIVHLAEKYDSFVMVDDAHATGVFGSHGTGIVEHFNLGGKVAVQVGTLSKALASCGGYVTGKSDLINYLRNKARSFIYSTGLPPAAVGAAIAAVDLIREKPEIRARLFDNVNFLSEGLTRLGFTILTRESQIIPILVGDDNLTMDMDKALFERGVFVTGIRPPSVPPGTSRLRVSVMATHKREDLEEVLNVFESAGREIGLI
ncbi:MAG TPA: 8-amino-7-oxononanoate synthase [Desulfotomaculum sp.]|nr:MAG: 8-amino-7-oxononanoate synthase [Desulfotomaculum sp. 46_80]HAG10382.1 8-amino-7-oxononanoate synthase [Desulfotomaculum sp.]HBY04171.1 8-amino-7-oxononanoate synthase [Desulfotomaculum sp.]